MVYKVINDFIDLQDNEEHIYVVGDVFPRQDMSVSESRIKQLSTTDNPYGFAFIEETVDFSKYMNKPAEDCKYTKTDIVKMSVADLRKLALENGVENADKLKGAELKRVLCEKLDL